MGISKLVGNWRLPRINFYVICIVLISLVLKLIFINSANLLVEEAYYWNYSIHLDFGYLDHPPMLAVLIKIANMLFGAHAFAIRAPSLLCYALTLYFNYRLSEAITRDSGQYAVLLLSIMPFFFLQFLVMTPDQPLIVCWSAVLYCLYCAVILNKTNYWYAAGIWFGLGLISKYTIVLLVPSLVLYLLLTPDARHWFFRKEPYLCALIGFLFFTPVIYWNATHEWASFIFQSTRRFQDHFYFSLHHFVGLLLLFLLPIGCSGLFNLFKKSYHIELVMSKHIQRFLQVFVMLPLIFFMVFSVIHAIKFDWIGPVFLALIPWLTRCMVIPENNNKQSTTKKQWLITIVILLIVYACMMIGLLYWCPSYIEKRILPKFIAWDNLTMQFNHIAQRTEKTMHKQPIFVPLDSYNIASELSFYQNQLWLDKKIPKIYPIMGGHIFGVESLMFRYWSKDLIIQNKPLILITTNLMFLENLQKQIIPQSSIQRVWSYNQRGTIKITLYYYQIVQYL